MLEMEVSATPNCHQRLVVAGQDGCPAFGREHSGRRKDIVIKTFLYKTGE